MQLILLNVNSIEIALLFVVLLQRLSYCCVHIFITDRYQSLQAEVTRHSERETAMQTENQRLQQSIIQLEKVSYIAAHSFALRTTVITINRGILPCQKNFTSKSVSEIVTFLNPCILCIFYDMCRCPIVHICK